jgi:hypothetical protein
MLNVAMSLQQVAWRMQHAARVFAMEIRRGTLARTRRTNRLSRSAMCKYASFRAILMGTAPRRWGMLWMGLAVVVELFSTATNIQLYAIYKYSFQAIRACNMQRLQHAACNMQPATCNMQHATPSMLHAACNMQQLYAKVSLMADPCKERPPVPIPRGQRRDSVRAVAAGFKQATERLTARLCMRRGRLRSRRHAALSSGARG